MTMLLFADVSYFLEQRGVVGVPVDVQSVWSPLQVTCCAPVDLLTSWIA